jgi:hypothetical protein
MLDDTAMSRRSEDTGAVSEMGPVGEARRVARRLRRVSSVVYPDHHHERAPLSSEAASALIEGLRSLLTVTYVPLDGVVAVLDTTSSAWTLHLDADSPAEDHCWAMIDVVEVLRLGPQAAEHATRTIALRGGAEPSVGPP